MLLSIIKSSLLTKPFYSLAAVALGYLHGLEIPSLKLDDMTRIDKLIASYDCRRDAAIRELKKRRDLLAKRAREVADTVITDVAVAEVLAAE